MKGELEIGDIIVVHNNLLQCREQQGNSCKGCWWLDNEEHCNHHHHLCGRCSEAVRTDNIDVIFVKVGEVPDS